MRQLANFELNCPNQEEWQVELYNIEAYEDISQPVLQLPWDILPFVQEFEDSSFFRLFPGTVVPTFPNEVLAASSVLNGDYLVLEWVKPSCFDIKSERNQDARATIFSMLFG